MDTFHAIAHARRMQAAAIGRRSLARGLGGVAAGLALLPVSTVAARQDEADAAEHSAIIALTAVLEDAAAEFGTPVAEIAVQNLEARDWPDACLGLAGEGEGCAEVITPGYRVVLAIPTGEIVYRTDQRGGVRREPAEATQEEI